MDGLHLAQVVFCGLVYDSRSFTVGCISGVTKHQGTMQEGLFILDFSFFPSFRGQPTKEVWILWALRMVYKYTLSGSLDGSTQGVLPSFNERRAMLTELRRILSGIVGIGMSCRVSSVQLKNTLI